MQEHESIRKVKKNIELKKILELKYSVKKKRKEKCYGGYQ